MNPVARTVAAAVAIGLLAVACGSTVDITRTTAGRSDALDVPAVSGHDGLAAVPSARGRAPSGVAGGSAAATRASTRSVDVGAVPRSGTHRDTSPVKLGFVVIRGGNAFVAALFGAGTPANFGDGELEARAAVNDINSHGGINGRRIVPVFAQWDVSSGANGYEATCRQLTEDYHVFAIATVVNIVEQFVACGAKHATPILNASFGPGDDAMYARYRDWFFSPTLTTLNRENELVLGELASSRRMTPATRVGVVYSTADAQYTRVLKTTVEPILRRRHIPYQTYGVANQSDINGAVLRFSNDGVKLVVFISPNGINQILFMQQAEQQRWRPMYGLGDSADTWFIGEAGPDEQVRNISGAGALPISNVPVSRYPTTPREKHCLDLIRNAGEDNADRHSSLTATLYCELAYEFAAITSHVQGRLTPATWRAAYTTTATSYHPISTFSVDTRPVPHANAAQYRAIGYDNGCSCLSYVSPLRSMPH